MIKAVYFGEKKTGEDCLKVLQKHPEFEIVGVSSHSKNSCFQTSCKTFPFIFHDRIEPSAILEQVSLWKPEAIISVDNSFIFTEPFLKIVNDNAYNLHFGNRHSMLWGHCTNHFNKGTSSE